MVVNPRFLTVSMGAAALLATVAVASCAPSSSLQQVRTSLPSVTYEYRGDQELLQAQGRATTYCQQYQAVPGPARITRGSSGDAATVTFECDPAQTLAGTSQGSSAPRLTFGYRSDQELLDASRSAEAYCLGQGAQRAVASLGTNADGSKTVTFRCTTG
jgi:hypothetical protein